ncbi:hypothetical protein LINPERHAP2_LOCUS41433 [Linum perenne]
MMQTRIPGCTLLAVSHIKSKVSYFKNKFCALLELKHASGFSWDKARGCVVVDDDVFSGWVKFCHPKASGLNNKPLPFWDDLYFSFGAEMATGADAVQLGDATSKVHSRGGISSPVGADVEKVDSYTIPSNVDHNAVMEDLINQGIDVHASSLKDIEAEITSKNAAAKGKQTGTSLGSKRPGKLFMEDDRAQIVTTMAIASDNIARIADSYYIEGELAVRRQSLYQELSGFPDLTSSSEDDNEAPES